MKEKINEKKGIAVIAAMPSEIETIRKEFPEEKTETVAGVEVYSGSIGSCNVVLMQCGIGKVSAAAGAQALILKYHPDFVINTGCAGAIDGNLRIGDIVIADSTVEWDLDLMSLGLPRGYISSLDTVFMKTDSKLADELERNFQKKGNIMRGLVVSGDQFVDKASQRKLITDAFPGALCAEMEGAAIGHVCIQNGVPFGIVRAMSDSTDGNSSITFAAFSEQAGKRSAEVLLNMMKTM